MKKITKIALILAGASNLHATDSIPYADNPFWGKNAAESGYINANIQMLKSQIQERLRSSSQNPLSRSEYQFMHAPTAKGGIGAAWIKASLNPGVPVLLFEDSGINHPGIYISSKSHTSPHPSFMQSQDHGASTSSLTKQVSPKSETIVRYVNLEDIGLFPNVSILNFSNDISAHLLKTKIEALKGKIVIKSAGNHAQNLSEKGWGEDMSDFVLFAGNLRQDFRISPSSGRPGDYPHIQNNFLWVMADGIMSATGPGGSIPQYSPTSGTSLSAAILSGAVAQMMERFPEFSSVEIKECLTESADTDFIQTFEDGHDGVHVSKIHKKPGVATDLYDSSIWGKGILNLKNAIIYGNLKRAQKNSPATFLRPKTSKSHRLDMAIQEMDIKRASNLRFQMMKEIHQERLNAALIIQRNWWKSKDKVKFSPKRDPLTLDPFKPGFSYEKALEKALEEALLTSIPDLTPLEEKRLRGILSNPARTKGIRKMNILEARPEIFNTYPFLENISDSISSFPTLDEFMTSPAQTAQALETQFGASLGQEFSGRRFCGFEYGRIRSFKNKITPLSRFADVLVARQEKTYTAISTENVAAIEQFATSLLTNGQTPHKAVLQFLTILKEKSFFWNLSDEFLNVLHQHNLLTELVIKTESTWENNQYVYHSKSVPFYEIDFFTPSQIQRTTSNEYLNKLLGNKNFFLVAIREFVGYADPIHIRMDKMLSFFTDHANSPDKEIFKEALMTLELSYSLQCSRDQFNTWKTRATEIGVDLNEDMFQNLEIHEDER